MAGQSRWRTLGLLAVLGPAIWLPRGLALDRFVTVDEPSWLTFSGNFYQALAHAEFAHTFQIVHPGVTTTWVGTAALLWRYPAYAKDVPGQVNWVEQEIGPFLQAQGHDPVDVLATARAIMVVGITVTLGLASVAAARLAGFAAALLGFLLIAADPFHIALSRVLHVDALASSLMLLALLAYLNYLHRGRRGRDLVVSGVAAGLAWLTKVPALFLVPFIGALTLRHLWSVRHGPRRVSLGEVGAAARPFVLWGAVGLLVFVIVWPAMWVDPVTILRTMARDALGLAKSGHQEAPLFFNGAIVRDPGWLFYPITYLWRTTPVVLAGLALATVSLGVPWMRPAERSHRLTAGVLLLFAVLFTFLMSIGGKKFDRYLLPVYAPLDLVAAMGWLAAMTWLKNRAHQFGRLGAASLGGVAVAGQFATAIPAFPYYFSYYNPLLGGTAKAPGVMMVGWGEGLDQAARYLNALPGADRLGVSTWFWNGTFSYFFRGQSLPGRFTPDSAALRQWLSTDYCVLVINQRQRGRLPRELVDYVAGLKPVRVVRIQGLEYAQIYHVRASPIPAYLTGERSSRPAGE